MTEKNIYGYRIKHTYPNITEEENEKILRDMLLELSSIFNSQLTQK